jgi:hypothetical protein
MAVLIYIPTTELFLKVILEQQYIQLVLLNYISCWMHSYPHPPPQLSKYTENQ